MYVRRGWLDWCYFRGCEEEDDGEEDDDDDGRVCLYHLYGLCKLELDTLWPLDGFLNDTYVHIIQDDHHHTVVSYKSNGPNGMSF